MSQADITFLGAGWDNAIYRVGPHLVARFPRNRVACKLLTVEQLALTYCHRQGPAPLAIPKLVARCQPTELFDAPWSLVTWIPGESFFNRPADKPRECREQLTKFLVWLHQPASAAVPANRYRGVDLPQRDKIFRQNLEQTPDDVAEHRAQIERIWDQLCGTFQWDTAPLSLHGDLHPGNLLTHRQKLCAIVDWGDFCAGDPASDLSVAWMLFDHSSREAFQQDLHAAGHPADAAMWARARGWALALGVAHVIAPSKQHQELGRQTIQRALTN